MLWYHQVNCSSLAAIDFLLNQWIFTLGLSRSHVFLKKNEYNNKKILILIQKNVVCTKRFITGNQKVSVGYLRGRGSSGVTLAWLASNKDQSVASVPHRDMTTKHLAECQIKTFVLFLCLILFAFLFFFSLFFAKPCAKRFYYVHKISENSISDEKPNLESLKTIAKLFLFGTLGIRGV